MRTNVLVVSLLTDGLVADLVHFVHDLLAVASVSGLLVVERGLQLGSILDCVVSECARADVDRGVNQWVSSDVVFLFDIGIVFLEILTGDLSAPDGEISDNFGGVSGFFIPRLFFLNSDVDAVGLKVLVPQRSWVVTISGLHSSEDAWSNLVELGVLEAEGLSLVSDRVLGESDEPLSVVVLGHTPGNPRDLFSSGHSLAHALLLGLDLDLESSVGHVSHSGEVGLFILVSSDLREHDRSFFTRILAFEDDLLPILISVGLTSDNPRSVRKLVSTGFDNHEGHSFSGVLVILI